MASDDQWRTEHRYDGTTYYVNRETGDRLTSESQEFGPAQAVLKDEFGNVKASGAVSDSGFDLKDRSGNSVFRIGGEFDGYNNVPTIRDSSGSFLGSLGGGFLGSILNPFRWFDDSSGSWSAGSPNTSDRGGFGGHRRRSSQPSTVHGDILDAVVGAAILVLLGVGALWFVLTQTTGSGASGSKLTGTGVAVDTKLPHEVDIAASAYYSAKQAYVTARVRGDTSGMKRAAVKMKSASQQLNEAKRANPIRN